MKLNYFDCVRCLSDYTYVVGTNVMGAIELALLHPFNPQVTWHKLATPELLHKLDRLEQVAIS